MQIPLRFVLEYQKILILIFASAKIHGSNVCDLGESFISTDTISLNLTISAVKRNANASENEIKLLFPEEDLDAWAEANGYFYVASSKDKPLSERENNRSLWGYSKFAYDVLVSDKIGPTRSIPDTRHELCQSLHYDEEGLSSASIVICYHNEALSVLIRMVNSIFQRSPQNLVHEILLIDDWSDPDLIITPYLTKYGATYWPYEKVLVFLDSHCEVNQGWLEPILRRIADRPETVVEPVIDIIDAATFNYFPKMFGKGGFNWNLGFGWHYVPWSYFDDPENYTKPLEAPAVCGGLFGVRKAYFHYLGDFDTGMQVWGGENIEFSIRTWTCGGRIEVLPCSRVGHVSRWFRPYSKAHDSVYTNSLRVARVWLDDYIKNYFTLHPHLAAYDYGNVTDRVELRKKLDCKSFEWYLDNVYPELKVAPIDLEMI